VLQPQKVIAFTWDSWVGCIDIGSNFVLEVTVMYYWAIFLSQKQLKVKHHFWVVELMIKLVADCVYEYVITFLFLYEDGGYRY
jgi:hypothetical protein